MNSGHHVVAYFQVVLNFCFCEKKEWIFLVDKIELVSICWNSLLFTAECFLFICCICWEVQLETVPGYRLILRLTHFFFFLFGHKMQNVVFSPLLGIEPVPPVFETQSLNHWTAREVWNWYILKWKLVPEPFPITTHF